MTVTPKGFMCLAIIMMVVASCVDAQILGGGVNLVTVTGSVFCSPNGAPCADCPPLVNAMVNLRLSDSARNISSTRTQLDGTFQIQVTDVGTLLAGILTVINPSGLEVIVDLPVGNCPALATATGVLEGTPVLRAIANNGAVIELAVPVGTFNRNPLA